MNDAPAPAEMASKVNRLFAAHEKHLSKKLLAFLASRNDLRILGPSNPDNRAATFALDTDRSAFSLAEQLAQKKIMAGASDFYAVRLLEAMGVETDPGALRLSFVHYTNEKEIDQLIAAMRKVL